MDELVKLEHRGRGSTMRKLIENVFISKSRRNRIKDAVDLPDMDNARTSTRIRSTFLMLPCPMITLALFSLISKIFPGYS